jgi:signal transduction histidine kinase
MKLSGSGQKNVPGNTLMFAVLTLALIGLSLVWSTWQNLQQERQTALQYLTMNARSVAQTVETTFRRFLRMQGRMDGRADKHMDEHAESSVKSQENRFWSGMGELYSDTEGESEVVFIAVIDESGRSIFEAGRDKNMSSLPQSFKEPGLAALTSAGEWSGLEDDKFFLYAKPMRRFDGWRHKGMAVQPDSYIAVGLSLKNNQALYQRFRNNALLQSVYVLAAALFTWFLALRLIARHTRLHELEQSLAEAEKKAAVGVLAAGVAHEIRNPLAALRGFAQYFAKKFSGVTPDEEYAQTMVREADRLNRVVTDLLYLTRDKVTQKYPVVLSQLVSDLSDLLRFDLESRQVSLSTDLQVDMLLADADSLKQALLNLILNSLDAFEDVCSDHSPSRPARFIQIRSFGRDGLTCLEVEDNGRGMTDEQKRKAVDAFFSTKAKGTGLGLSLVDKIMREHGGKILISSESGQGCKVSLYFSNQIICDKK